jgi:hypothetical protein
MYFCSINFIESYMPDRIFPEIGSDFDFDFDFILSQHTLPLFPSSRNDDDISDDDLILKRKCFYFFVENFDAISRHVPRVPVNDRTTVSTVLLPQSVNPCTTVATVNPCTAVSTVVRSQPANPCTTVSTVVLTDKVMSALHKNSFLCSKGSAEECDDMEADRPSCFSGSKPA